eukprot:11499536-Ditylum_brightwellii.AAC.1
MGACMVRESRLSSFKRDSQGVPPRSGERRSRSRRRSLGERPFSRKQDSASQCEEGGNTTEKRSPLLRKVMNSRVRSLSPFSRSRSRDRQIRIVQKDTDVQHGKVNGDGQHPGVDRDQNIKPPRPPRTWKGSVLSPKSRGLQQKDHQKSPDQRESREQKENREHQDGREQQEQEERQSEEVEQNYEVPVRDTREDPDLKSITIAGTAFSLF